MDLNGLKNIILTLYIIFEDSHHVAIHEGTIIIMCNANLQFASHACVASYMQSCILTA